MIRRLAACGKLLRALARDHNLRTLLFAPPGHFYSPLPDLRDVERRSDEIFADRADLPGIDLNAEGQIALLHEFSAYYGELPFAETPVDGLRYAYRNPFFGYGDAVILYSFLRHFRPRRVIEVGSGHSSAVMLDTRQTFPGPDTELTFIEPYADRLKELMTARDRDGATIIEQGVQDVPLETFDVLAANDILFIDSSHVVKCGSDLEHIFFRVLPRLKPGVIIHFHDIHWPFQYPRDWIRGGRAWNEVYFLHAYLYNNRQLQITYFNAYMAARHSRDVKENLPLCLRNPGGGIWLRTVGDNLNWE